MSFQVKSRLYLGLIGVKWSQYATYFHLGPIQGLYEEDMLVIYHDFDGNLPFTGILQEVYGLPYATSTHFRNVLTQMRTTFIAMFPHKKERKAFTGLPSTKHMTNSRNL